MSRHERGSSLLEGNESIGWDTSMLIMEEPEEKAKTNNSSVPKIKKPKTSKKLKRRSASKKNSDTTSDDSKQPSEDVFANPFDKTYDNNCNDNNVNAFADAFDFLGLQPNDENNNDNNNNNNNSNSQTSYLEQQPVSSFYENDNNNNNHTSNNNNNEQDYYDFGFGMNNSNSLDNKNRLKTASNPNPSNNGKNKTTKHNKKYSSKNRKNDCSSDDDDGSSEDSESSMSELSENEYKSKSSKYHNTTGNGMPSPNSSAKKVKPPHSKRHSEPVTTASSKHLRSVSAGDPKSRAIGVNVKKGKIANLRGEDYKNNNNNNNKKPKSLTKKKSKYNVLPELKRGTALLKYGRHGYPHFRQFNVSEDNSQLIWFSTKKNQKNSSIHVSQIDDVITGQHTKEFSRIGWTTLKPASFSIIYNKKKSSLNVVAKSVDEMKMWVDALRTLRDLARKGEDLSKLRKIEIEIDFRDRNRPQSRKHSGNFLRSHETKEHQVDQVLYRKLMNDLDALRKLYKCVEKEARSEIVQSTPEWPSIEQILSEMEERIEELVHEVTHTRNTKIAENDVWRTRIDLESLREKIKVLDKRNKKNFNNKRRWSVFN